MLFLIVFTVNSNMPNLSAIEVAKAHLAAKDKAKHDAVIENTTEDESRKTRGGHSKSNQRKPVDNNETETTHAGKPIQLATNAEHEDMNDKPATEENASAVPANVPKETTLVRTWKTQRTKQQRAKEAAAEKRRIAKEKDVLASTALPDKPLSNRRQASVNNVITKNTKGKEVATSDITDARHVDLIRTTIKESQPEKERDDKNDETAQDTTEGEDEATPSKHKGVLKRDLSTTPSSASQDSYGETPR
jgi:hypothetical protein